MSVTTSEYTAELYDIDVEKSSYRGRISIAFEPSRELETLQLSFLEQLSVGEVKLTSDFSKTEAEIVVQARAEKGILTLDLKHHPVLELLKNVVTIFFTGVLGKGFNGTQQLRGTAKDVGFFDFASKTNRKNTVKLELVVGSSWNVQSNGKVLNAKAVGLDGKKGGNEDVELKKVVFEAVEIELKDLFWELSSK